MPYVVMPVDVVVLRGGLSTNLFSVHDIGTESYEFCRGSSCRSMWS
jgi:hypothetical protein